MNSNAINFGDCYINYQYQKEFVLVNESSMPGKIAIGVQEDSAKNVYRYICGEYEGIINGDSSKYITVNIEVKRLGKISFPLLIQIQGEQLPFPVDLQELVHIDRCFRAELWQNQARRYLRLPGKSH